METEIFKEDLDVIQHPYGGSFPLEDMFLADNQDYFFAAKWDEVWERYRESRVYAEGAIREEWKDQFNSFNNEKARLELSYRFKSDLYEMALISYNIVVDLTWTWTYVSAEYAFYTFDEGGMVKNSEEIYDMCSIAEAYDLLRKAEGNVSAPTTKDNPFGYLKDKCPSFSEAIDTIINFWEDFSDSDIRKLYNYIKHRGKPLYKEMGPSGKLYKKYINNEECVSTYNDVQYVISVDEGLEEIIAFDNEKLFPYVKTLLDQLITAVNPSPAAFI